MTDPRVIPDLPLEVGSGLEEARTVANSQATLTQLMSPGDANLWGNVFGGVILALVDKVAWISAARHCENPCVTASFDQVDFRAPIEIGALRSDPSERHGPAQTEEVRARREEVAKRALAKRQES